MSWFPMEAVWAPRGELVRDDGWFVLSILRFYTTYTFYSIVFNQSFCGIDPLLWFKLQATYCAMLVGLVSSMDFAIAFIVCVCKQTGSSGLLSCVEHEHVFWPMYSCFPLTRHGRNRSVLTLSILWWCHRSVVVHDVVNHSFSMIESQRLYASIAVVIRGDYGKLTLVIISRK